jgi:starch synthase
MRIVMAASEMTPLARTGGLGDVLEAFPAELVQRGHEVSVILPFYRCVREHLAGQPTPTGVSFPVLVGSRSVEAEVLETRGPSGVQVFLIRRDEYFDRSGLYGADSRPYDDNAERFIFFSKAVVELSRRLTPSPDLLHLHDWQTALVPVFVREAKLPFHTVLTIHNIAHQGSFWAFDFNLTNLPGSWFGPQGVEFYGAMNCLKGGIISADAVTTVSARYARELQTAEFGSGLDAVLREHHRKFTGILNGADYAHWNPATDRHLPRRYDRGNLAGKKTCRQRLLRELELRPKPTGPVFAMVTRLAEQKGLDLLLPLLDRLLADNIRLIVLGEGETRYERDLLVAEKKHRETFSFRRGWEERLSHLILAGADATLIPSHFEPCGLSAMHSLRYGTIPVARACGGLHQIIRDLDPSTGSGNGFLFFDYTPDALWDALRRARRLFAEPAAWQQLTDHAMAADFSWAAAAEGYEKIYRRLTV